MVTEVGEIRPNRNSLTVEAFVLRAGVSCGKALERERSEDLCAAVFCRKAEGGGCIMDR
jgi:hypothetical protein